MRKWDLFTFWVFVAFGALSALAAVLGIALLFFAPPTGVMALLIAAVLGVMSFSVKRSFDTMTTRQDS